MQGLSHLAPAFFYIHLSKKWILYNICKPTIYKTNRKIDKKTLDILVIISRYLHRKPRESERCFLGGCVSRNGLVCEG